jgi:hypothetical protein
MEFFSGPGWTCLVTLAVLAVPAEAAGEAVGTVHAEEVTAAAVEEE